MTDTITSTGSVGTIQYSGLTSDTKWADLVDDLIGIERLRLERFEEWKTEWQDKSKIIGQLESNLLVLESRAGDLNSSREFLATKSTSSDTDIMTVTSNSFASTGAHSVTVGSTIPHMLASQGLSSNSTAVGVIGTQDLVIVVGSNTITVEYNSPALGTGDFDSNSTLADLVTAINNDPENSSYVTASIKGDGSSDNMYRLVLTADTGGDDNLISITSNPLNLNFNTNNISNTVETTWAGASATASGTSTATQNKTYTFTAAASGTVGQSGSLLINWSDGTGNTGSIEVGSSYSSGTELTVADGIDISLASGSITSGEIFLVNVYNNLEDVEQTDWNDTFPTPEKAGYYTGNTNKIFNFAILDDGTLGSDEIDLYWEDTEGNSDTVTIPDTYSSGDELTIFQGVTVTFDTSSGSTLQESGKFSITAYHPTIQAGQDNGLAQVEVETHAGFVDSDITYATTTSATFSYTYNGVTTDVPINAYSTLDDIASEINSDSNNPGITATIVNDGSGTNTAYHLQLIGNDTGSAYKIEDISHNLNNLSGSSSDDYDFTETQSAQNSMVRVDGYPTSTSEYIQRLSNTVADIITGVTISLVDTGTATISTTTDNSAIIENVQEFVDALNDVLDYITAMTTYIEAGDESYKGPMAGNYSFQIIEQRIHSILVDAVPGLTDGTDTYTVLSQVGINTDNDQITIEDKNAREWTTGTRRWVLDEAAFSEALGEDIDAVVNLFVQNTNTSVDGMAEIIRAEADKLTKEYADENPGILQVLSQNYKDIIEGIDVKIEREELRISMVETRLDIKFAALETMLGQLSGQENMLGAILDSMKE